MSSSQALDRAGSVDDLLGNFWRLGQAGMGRTDSEAAFQEFLKRIPSTTNLAAAVAESSQAAAQVASASQPGGASAAGSLPSLPDVVTSAIGAVGGMPRVPSLGLFRQLVSIPVPPPATSAPAASAPPVKLEAAPTSTSSVPAYRLPDTEVFKPVAVPATTIPPPPPLPAGPPLPAPYALPPGALAGLAGLPDLSQLSAVGAALQGVPGFAVQGPNPLAAATLTPAAAAAAALQLGQLGQLGARITNASAAAAQTTVSGSDKDMDKVDQRRARRMLSNRESARRSRRRKQEHLSKLEEERNVLDDERRDLEKRVAAFERRVQSVDDENRRLREENERLKDELRFLRTEITGGKDRNGYHHHPAAYAPPSRGRAPAADSEDEQQPAKRHRHSDRSSSDHEALDHGASDGEVGGEPKQGAQLVQQARPGGGRAPVITPGRGLEGAGGGGAGKGGRAGAGGRARSGSDKWRASERARERERDRELHADDADEE